MPPRRKPRAARKEQQIRVLVTAEQKTTIEAAAHAADMAPATWLRNLALRAAKHPHG
jgi:hypothetical protein